MKLTETAERIKAVARIACTMNDPAKVIIALDSLMGWCSFFPDPAKINQEIIKLRAGGVNALDKATVDCKLILDTVKSCGFDAELIKKELDSRLYSAIGGALGIKEYGSGETPEGVFTKQLIDKLKSGHTVSEGKEKIDTVEKIIGKGEVERVIGNKDNKPQLANFNKFQITDNS